METKTTNNYDVATSDARLKEILDSSENFEEVNYIPSRNNLTYKNGYYVNCTSVFIDIRSSSQLPQLHKKPVLGKIYRAYLSECVALMNNDPNCREVVINGDCVHGIMDTQRPQDIDRTFQTAYSLNSLINILNWRLGQKNYTPINCGIGIAYGRALMMQAGFKGSGLNEVIWMGDVVNEASNLCHQGNKNGRKAIQVSTSVFNFLKKDNTKYLTPVCNGILGLTHYEGDIGNSAMIAWLNGQKSQSLNQSPLGLASLLRNGSSLY
jgi:class 3 adenylate cyclase